MAGTRSHRQTDPPRSSKTTVGRRGGRGDCAPNRVTGQASGPPCPGEDGYWVQGPGGLFWPQGLGQTLPLHASDATLEGGDNGGPLAWESTEVVGRLARWPSQWQTLMDLLSPRQARASPQDGAESPWQIPSPGSPFLLPENAHGGLFQMLQCEGSPHRRER